MGSTQLLSTSTKSHAKMCKPHWSSCHAFGVHKISHIFNHIHAKISLISNSIQILNWMIEASSKGCFYMNTKNHVTFTKYEHLELFMQSLHWSGNYWLESTPSHELQKTKQKITYYPLWQKKLNVLIISNLHDSCVNGYPRWRARWLDVYEYFDCR